MTKLRVEEIVNPYAPPQTFCCAIPVFDAGNGLYVSLVSRGLVYRRIRLSGAVAAEVEYNGRHPGYETVSVDGQIVSRQSALWSLALAPLHYFTLGPDKTIPAAIQIRGVLTLRGFRLWVVDRVVYDEGSV